MSTWLWFICPCLLVFGQRANKYKIAADQSSQRFFRPNKFNCSCVQTLLNPQMGNWPTSRQISILFFLCHGLRLTDREEEGQRSWKPNLWLAPNFAPHLIFMLPQIYCHKLQIINYESTWKSQQGNNISTLE